VRKNRYSRGYYRVIEEVKLKRGRKEEKEKDNPISAVYTEESQNGITSSAKKKSGKERQQEVGSPVPGKWQQV